MFAFSSLFSPQFISGSFDNAIERDAANGRVSAMLTNALANAYGLALPASPVQAIKTINEVLTLAKAPKLAQGPGAKAHAPAVAQALHALGTALHEAGKVKGLPNLVSLPGWANPEKLEAAKKARAEERAAKKAAAGAIVAPPAATAAGAIVAPAPTLDVHEHITIVIAAIKGGHVSAKDLAILRAALETAQSAPTKSKKPIAA